jgi:hypothetical protein
VEDKLIKQPNFALPGKKALMENDSSCDVVLADVSESPIQRPKKSQKASIPERKKRHTLKAQIVVSKAHHKILCNGLWLRKKARLQAF